MPKVTGIVKIYVDGEIYRSKEGAKLNTGGYERTAQTGFKVYGHSEKLVPAVIEMTVAHMADTDIEAINSMRDATVKFETDTGTSYVVANATTTKPAELTGGEGDLAVEISGDPAVEQKAS